MVFTHMDQLGFFVRKIEADGMVRVERMGGVPERALAPGGAALRGRGARRARRDRQQEPPRDRAGGEVRGAEGAELASTPGHGSKAAVEAAGVRIGTPVVYRPNVMELAGGRIAGTSVDDRAGCAVLVEVARALKARTGGPTVHVVFSVQEEFNLRGRGGGGAGLKPTSRSRST
jgi:putative aminopeptidase